MDNEFNPLTGRFELVNNVWRRGSIECRPGGTTVLESSIDLDTYDGAIFHLHLGNSNEPFSRSMTVMLSKEGASLRSTITNFRFFGIGDIEVLGGGVASAANVSVTNSDNFEVDCKYIWSYIYG